MSLPVFARRVAVGALLVLSATEACAESATRTRLVTTSPSHAGDSVTMTAEVDAFGVGGAPRGSVAFFDGETALGSGQLNVLGTSQAILGAGPFHMCAITSGGGLGCWGSNNSGQLGDGTTTDRTTKVPVAGLASGVAQVTGGAWHSCALTSAGGVKCWGSNIVAQLGDATGGLRVAPATVPGLAADVVAIAAGYFHTCALITSGRVMCWGHDNEGQIGSGPFANYSLPTLVDDPGTVYTAVAAGGFQSCGLTSAGAVKCWGHYFGSHPTVLPGLDRGVAAFATGYSHLCALTTAGAVKCWGSNNAGQLGDGTRIDRGVAVPVVGLSSGVVAVAAGQHHSCASTTSGAVRCWGRNHKGKLGDGTTTDRLTPVSVARLDGFAVAIATGDDSSCALLSPSRELRCWGDNDTGQLGDGTKRSRLLPVSVRSFHGLLRARTRRHAPLAVGSHPLRAGYAGNETYPPSSSPVLIHKVQ